MEFFISTNTVTYTYGNADWKDQLTSFNGEAITYDAIGNPLTYRGMTFTWQNGRELASITKTGLSASYVYNDSGLRTGKTVNGATTEYYWDDSRLLAQKTNGEYLYFLYDENGSMIGFTFDGLQYLYVRNLQGDIVSVVSASTGNSVAQYTYDSWGNILTATGTMAEVNPIRYRGYYYDTETGLYYLQSRYYDSEVGRFLNADSFSFLGASGTILDYNLYFYCLNNPIILADYSGCSVAGSIVAAGGIIGGTNFWNPVGWTMAAIAAVGLIYLTVDSCISYTKAQEKVSTRDRYFPDTKVREQIGAHYTLAYISKFGDLIKVGAKMSFERTVVMLGASKATTIYMRQMYQRNKSSYAQRKLEHMGNGNWGIYADSQAAAKALAITFGGVNPPEVHSSGMYAHYHDATHSFHIWYGGIVTY